MEGLGGTSHRLGTCLCPASAELLHRCLYPAVSRVPTGSSMDASRTSPGVTSIWLLAGPSITLCVQYCFLACIAHTQPCSNWVPYPDLPFLLSSNRLCCSVALDTPPYFSVLLSRCCTQCSVDPGHCYCLVPTCPWCKILKCGSRFSPHV